MNFDQQINIDNYNYKLPEDRIAKYPLEKRDASNLLVHNCTESGYIKDIFENVSKYLPADSLIVFNNTKVINARMFFKKETGAIIEIFCLEPISPVDYSMSLSSNISCNWKCLIGNNKKWKNGNLSKRLVIRGIEVVVSIERIKKIGNAFEVNFTWDNTDIHFSDILSHDGKIPIPPYLNRESENSDSLRYQTIYGEPEGSVAAPTAGLHFTDKVLNSLNKINIKSDFVTLHVGAGTFHPVKTDNIFEHTMHSEHFIVTRENLSNIIKYFGNITVVGTTSVRTLESLFVIAAKTYIEPSKIDTTYKITQWEAYEDKYLSLKHKAKEVLSHLYDLMLKNEIKQITCSTQIMIVPGYKFVITNRLITNFHQPKSTLLLLISAFLGGDEWRNIYDYALNNNFRFLSYGDSCLFCQGEVLS